MLQALTLTMLGRNAFLSFGPFWGCGMLILLWAPTTIMSFYITPHIVKNFATVVSVAEVQHSVLASMRAEFEQAGDYAAASQALEMMANVKLRGDELHDVELVRSKVRASP